MWLIFAMRTWQAGDWECNIYAFYVCRAAKYDLFMILYRCVIVYMYISVCILVDPQPPFSQKENQK